MTRCSDQVDHQKEETFKWREEGQIVYDARDSKRKELEEKSRNMAEHRINSSSFVMEMQSNASSSTRTGGSKPGGYSGDESSDISDECDTSSDPSSNPRFQDYRKQNEDHQNDKGDMDSCQNSDVIHRNQAPTDSRHVDGDVSANGNISLHQTAMMHSKDALHTSSLSDPRPLLINPADPNIDLSCLDIVSAKEHDQKKYQQRKEKCNFDSYVKASSDINVDTVETCVDVYSRLLESCHQFFKVFQDEPLIVNDKKTSDERMKEDDIGDHDSVSSMIVLAPRPKHRKQKDLKSMEPLQMQDEPPIYGSEPLRNDSTSHIQSSEAKASSSHSSQGSSRTFSTSQKKEMLQLLECGANGLQKSSLNGCNPSQQHPQHQMNREGSNFSSSRRPALISESSGINSGSAAGTGSASGSGNETVKHEETISSEMTASGENNSISDALTKKSSIDESFEKKLHKHMRASAVKVLPQSDNVPASNDHNERLAAKKRKRMDQRKEFEDMVQNDMQNSSENSVQSIFQPGEYVSMEDALSFTHTARLIVQANPPYLVVHINAAFSRLTGIQNSTAIGKPLSKILILLSTHDQLTPSGAQEDGQSHQKDSEKDYDDSNDQVQAMKIDGSNIPDAGLNQSSGDLQKNRSYIESVITFVGFKQYYKVQTLDCRRENLPTSDCSISNYCSLNSSISSKDENIPRSCVMSVCAIHSHHRDRVETHSNHHHHHNSGAKRTKSCKEQAKSMVATHFLIQLFPLENEELIPERIAQPMAQSSETSSRLEDDSQVSGSSTKSKPVVACG